MEKRIETKADEFLMMLKHEDSMTVPELEKALGIDSKLLDEWIYLFEAKGIIDLIYPVNPLEPPYVVIRHGKKRTAEEI